MVCDSTDVARSFGYKHVDVVRVIKKLNQDIESLRAVSNPPKIFEYDNEYRGQNFVAYRMTREYFSLLAMRFKGVKALSWQIKFNSAFYEMERILLQQNKNKDSEEWVTARTQSKQMRLHQTDVIKDFVNYATEQGSVNAKFYYKHITNATYSALNLIQHKKPKLRDTLDLMELSQLMVAETVAKKRLQAYMSQGEHYKAIFSLVKQDLTNFGSSLLLDK